ncbi:MAG TPA: adenosine deaminase family protein [Bacteriovoracaceae bacterium]|nr:adenosine deaminase family protein [Bacteriovoracaceae bacterium]
MTKYNSEFIKEMPKTDLHLHLDGSLRIPTLIEMAKAGNIKMPSYTEEGLKETVFKSHYANLGEYLHGFQYTCSALRDLENIERASYELAWDNIHENVYYIEVRFAPQLMMDIEAGLTFESVMTAANKGFERAKKEFNNSAEVKSGQRPEFNYGIISCAMRKFGPKGYSPYYTNFYKAHEYSKEMDVLRAAAMQMVRAAVKIRDEQGIPIVSIDLAGQEDGYPPGKFKEVYAYAHQHFMHKTVHAGEAYGAESIFQAITECYADRIGHGYYLFDEDKIIDESVKDKKKYLSDLISFVADKRTTIEVCLTSNLQTNPSIKDIKDHNFKHMLANRMSLTICTDNRLVSDTTVSKEFQLAVDNFEIAPKHLKDLVAYGFKKSFYFGNYIDKRNWAKSMMKHFDKVAAKHNVEIK